MGTLSIAGEDEYFQNALREVIRTIAQYHSLDCKRLTRGEALRFLAHLDVASTKMYPELASCHDKLFVCCQEKLKALLRQGLDGLNNHPLSSFEIQT